MAKILVFTDLHMTDGQTIIGLDPVERFAQGLRHALEHHHDADRIVCTGDLANRGDGASYKILKDLLSRVPMPVDLLIGNHDSREAFMTVFPEWMRSS